MSSPYTLGMQLRQLHCHALHIPCQIRQPQMQQSGAGSPGAAHARPASGRLGGGCQHHTPADQRQLGAAIHGRQQRIQRDAARARRRHPPQQVGRLQPLAGRRPQRLAHQLPQARGAARRFAFGARRSLRACGQNDYVLGVIRQPARFARVGSGSVGARLVVAVQPRLGALPATPCISAPCFATACHRLSACSATPGNTLVSSPICLHIAGPHKSPFSRHTAPPLYVTW